MSRRPEDQPVDPFRPEVAALLCCARTVVDAAAAERLAALAAAGLDWDWILRTALRHGVAPLCYHTLSGPRSSLAPPAVRESLRAHAHANRLRNGLLTRELLRLVAALEQAGIVAVPYKGPALAVAAYGDIGLRQFTDLDILVPPSDVPAARAVLSREGYRPADPQVLPRASAERGELRTHYHDTYLRPDSGPFVELHWAFAFRHLSFTPDGLWDRLQTLSLAGTPVRTLAVEDLLPILCLHGAKHCWERLEWLCGVAELLRRSPDADWPAMLETARRSGTERILLHSLALARTLLDADLPAPIAHRLRQRPAPPSLAPRLCHWLFIQQAPLSPLQRHLYFLSMRDRLRDRLRYVLHELRTIKPADRVGGPRAGRLAPLYRPVRLLATYGNPWRVMRALAGSGNLT